MQVSTIHETLWSLIKGYQKELVEIHYAKIQEELSLLDGCLYSSSNPEDLKVFKAFRDLDDNGKKVFVGIALSTKEIFYKHYDLSSAEFKTALGSHYDNLRDVLKNISNFKAIVRAIYRIDNYRNCLESISKKGKGFQTVKYDSKFNNDILHKMVISHDTLLNYGYKMFSKYPLLRKITIDSFPFVLVDEYQDTNANVIKILSILSEHARKINQEFVVGYFGDKVQNIYDDGIGGNITNLHSNLEVVDKLYNRRSCEEVINVINKIRNDNVIQETIFEENHGGEIKFFYNSSSDKLSVVKKFLQKCQRDWQISTENKLHCLVLTNRLVASLSGFGKLYEYFSKTPFYKKNYESINSELLSQDHSKLGKFPLVLSKILGIMILLGKKKVPVTSIFSNEIHSNLSLIELKKLLVFIKPRSDISLYDYCAALFDTHNNDPLILEFIKTIVELDTYTFASFKTYILNLLYPRISADEESEALKSIEEFLKLDFNEFKKWYEFICNVQNDEIVYLTYHGTKGLEFENVVIVMENDFGLKNKEMFSSYFKNVLNQSLNQDPVLLEKHEKTKNLLYVSCSRSKKNLRILYTDEVNDFKTEIEYVFGQVEVYNF
ncbi:MAG: ATP-dependent DNA helicase Rep [Holosporales bacterium]